MFSAVLADDAATYLLFRRPSPEVRMNSQALLRWFPGHLGTNGAPP